MTHLKRRAPAVPGSIPDVLKMFESEVRFYREIAPYVGVRVPECYRAEAGPDGTLLELATVLPSVMVQGYLSLSDLPDGEGAVWNARLEAAVGML